MWHRWALVLAAGAVAGTAIAAAAWFMLTSDAVLLQAAGPALKPPCSVLVIDENVPSIVPAWELELFLQAHPRASFNVPTSAGAALNERLRRNGNPAYPHGEAAWRFRLLPSRDGRQRIRVEVWGDHSATFTTYSATAVAIYPETVKTISILQGFLSIGAGAAGALLGAAALSSALQRRRASEARLGSVAGA